MDNNKISPQIEMVDDIAGGKGVEHILEKPLSWKEAYNMDNDFKSHENNKEMQSKIINNLKTLLQNGYLDSPGVLWQVINGFGCYGDIVKEKYTLNEEAIRRLVDKFPISDISYGNKLENRAFAIRHAGPLDMPGGLESKGYTYPLDLEIFEMCINYFGNLNEKDLIDLNFQTTSSKELKQRIVEYIDANDIDKTHFEYFYNFVAKLR